MLYSFLEASALWAVQPIVCWTLDDQRLKRDQGINKELSGSLLEASSNLSCCSCAIQLDFGSKKEGTEAIILKYLHFGFKKEGPSALSVGKLHSFHK